MQPRSNESAPMEINEDATNIVVPIDIDQPVPVVLMPGQIPTTPQATQQLQSPPVLLRSKVPEELQFRYGTLPDPKNLNDLFNNA
jgi:hypothetical protein